MARKPVQHTDATYISKSEFSQFIAEKNKLLAFSDAQKQLLDETVWAIREALGKLQKASFNENVQDAIAILKGVFSDDN